MVKENVDLLQIYRVLIWFFCMFYQRILFNVAKDNKKVTACHNQSIFQNYNYYKFG